MSSFASFFTTIVSAAVFLSNIFTVFLLVALFSPKVRFFHHLSRFVRRHILALGFIVSLVATLGSLTYSQIIGFEPCTLCWFQRIVMYPQVLLFGVALFKKERAVVDYSLMLSGVGVVIALYHVFVQFTPVSGPCSLNGATCGLIYFLQFEYITIPVMALSAFLLLFLSGFLARTSNSQKTEKL